MPKIVSKIDLTSEACLADEIEFLLPVTEFAQNPQAILLTGSTGFLGVCLLNELLLKTQAQIYCLVRAKDEAIGFERIKEQLEFYQFWQPEWESRIMAVIGDLAKPVLDLTDAQFSELSEKIDIIYHNGAYVNSMRPYASLKSSNVLGTKEVLRLASLVKTKPVHFISTLAVFFSPVHNGQVITENIKPSDTLQGGYKQSKWVAEQLILRAGQRGLPCNVYRPGRIMGHSETGITGNMTDLLTTVLKGCIEIGQIPDRENMVNIVPVDYVSRAIVDLALQQRFGESFHLINPQPVSWLDLVQMVRNLGYSLEAKDYDDWSETLKSFAAQKSNDKVYSPLLLLLRSSSAFFAKKPKFDTNSTQSQLKDQAITCPPVNQILVERYFKHFQNMQHIPAPK
ncbi:thioester reductase domain-containing protein [Candidatus Albibeggiatoa sp. nov. BB20]|uniref:thioester reductase domain-containing protein n=1 Tax=Candidatus Albibeggiatoa sp. nov. BB20 TaxID=3162723 RepID=UPI00336545BF